MPLPDLITVADYIVATGQQAGDVTATDQDQIAWAIAAASQSVRDYCDRRFVLVTDEVQGARTYTYQDNMEIEIDDCTSVSQVQVAPTTFDIGRTLDPTEYFPLPDTASGTINTIELFTLFGRGSYSPQMGFTRNLDTLPVIAYPVQLTITAVWGWPVIPANVKQAMIWGTADFLSDAGPYNSESIANYSRSYVGARAASTMKVNALPERALALLENYVRWSV